MSAVGVLSTGQTNTALRHSMFRGSSVQSLNILFVYVSHRRDFEFGGKAKGAPAKVLI